MPDYKRVWRTKAKEYLAIAFGGKCTICGYDKLLSALDYHHIKPETKSREMAVLFRNGCGWEAIVEEARKCTILCCRCHRELHAGIISLPKEYAKFNEEYSDIMVMKKKEFDNCQICNKEKWKKLQYCSLTCFHKSCEKFEITKEELELLVKEKPLTQIAKIYHVSDNAIKKRCKSLGVELNSGRGYWSKIKRE